MGLITEEVEVKIYGSNMKHYEELGYEIPKIKNKRGKLVLQKGATIKVKTKDLNKSSKVIVKVACDCCGTKKDMTYDYFNDKKRDDKFYCGKNLEEAHSANADTRATYEVLKAQLDRYPTLENDVDFLAKYSSQNRNVDLAGRIVLNDQDEEVFNFGKYKGQPVETVLKKDPGYFGWILQGDFAQNTKSVLTNIKLRMK